MPSNAEIVRELAKHIATRRRIYDSAFSADMKLLRQRHGDAAIVEALLLLEQPPWSPPWDAAAHRHAVADAIAGLLERRAEDPDGFDDGVKV
jgi:hypothetical protein